LPKNNKKKKILRRRYSQGHIQVAEEFKSCGFKIRNEFYLNTFPYDMYIEDLNLIVEYYGDRWHYNKNTYSPDFYDKIKNQYAWEKWEKDEEKMDFAKKMGFNIEIIWQSEWKKTSNKKLFIQRIVEKYEK